MKQFKAYLLNKHIIPEKKMPYYISWVSQFYAFCQKDVGGNISGNNVDRFFKKLGKYLEDWQIKQAKEAIDLYRFFLRKRSKKSVHTEMESEQVGSGTRRMARIVLP